MTEALEHVRIQDPVGVLIVYVRKDGGFACVTTLNYMASQALLADCAHQLQHDQMRERWPGDTK